METKEIFKEHPEYGFRISNFGQVTDLSGNKMSLLRGNYTQFFAAHKEDYSIKSFAVHRQVISLFKGPIPKGWVVNHKDCNKFNNHIDNLEMMTSSQNALHAIANGRVPPIRGENHYASKLKDEDVIKIYDLIKQGYNNQEIAEKYGINFRTASLIRNGDRWKHLFDIHMKEKIRSKKVKLPLSFCQKVINDLPFMSNKEIAIKYSLDPSTVSRIRYKKTWIRIWETIENKKCATTIESTSIDGSE